MGLVVALLGLANIGVLSAHQLGNRFHTKLAGKIRQALEARCTDWEETPKATALRSSALEEMDLRGQEISIGGLVHFRLRLIPVLLTALGIAIAFAALAFGATS